MYKVQVIVDDKLRDAAGALNTTANDAKSGELNQAATIGGTPTAVLSTVYDWATTTAVPALPNGNMRRRLLIYARIASTKHRLLQCLPA